MNALSPSPLRALSSIVDLICDQFDKETKSIIGDNIVVLKETLAKIDKVITEHETIPSIENEEPSPFPTPSTKTALPDPLPTAERAPDASIDNLVTKGNQQQETTEGQEGIKMVIQVDGNGEQFDDHPSRRRRSRKLSQPFLSPLEILSPNESQVSAIQFYSVNFIMNKKCTKVPLNQNN